MHLTCISSIEDAWTRSRRCICDANLVSECVCANRSINMSLADGQGVQTHFLTMRMQMAICICLRRATGDALKINWCWLEAEWVFRPSQERYSAWELWKTCYPNISSFARSKRPYDVYTCISKLIYWKITNNIGYSLHTYELFLLRPWWLNRLDHSWNCGKITSCNFENFTWKNQLALNTKC
jgi:hypothetical protein